MTNSGKVIYRTRSVLVEPTGDSYDSVVQSEQKLLQKLGRIIADYAKKNLKEGLKANGTATKF